MKVVVDALLERAVTFRWCSGRVIEVSRLPMMGQLCPLS